MTEYFLRFQGWKFWPAWILLMFYFSFDWAFNWDEKSIASPNFLGLKIYQFRFETHWRALSEILIRKACSSIFNEMHTNHFFCKKTSNSISKALKLLILVSNLHFKSPVEQFRCSSLFFWTMLVHSYITQYLILSLYRTCVPFKPTTLCIPMRQTCILKLILLWGVAAATAAAAHSIFIFLQFQSSVTHTHTHSHNSFLYVLSFLSFLFTSLHFPFRRYVTSISLYVCHSVCMRW